jgi:hypothetical protein
MPVPATIIPVMMMPLMMMPVRRARASLVDHHHRWGATFHDDRRRHVFFDDHRWWRIASSTDGWRGDVDWSCGNRRADEAADNASHDAAEDRVARIGTVGGGAHRQYGKCRTGAESG